MSKKQLDHLFNKYKQMNAIWRNRDFDVPVVIIDFLEFDGNTYAKIEGSKTCIPLDEIVFRGMKK